MGSSPKGRSTGGSETAWSLNKKGRERSVSNGSEEQDFGEGTEVKQGSDVYRIFNDLVFRRHRSLFRVHGNRARSRSCCEERCDFHKHGGGVFRLNPDRETGSAQGLDMA